jgi:hypothetical protein
LEEVTAVYDTSQYYRDGEDQEAEEKINFIQACLKSSFDAECGDALKKLTDKVSLCELIPLLLKPYS